VQSVTYAARDSHLSLSPSAHTGSPRRVYVAFEIRVRDPARILLCFSSRERSLSISDKIPKRPLTLPTLFEIYPSSLGVERLSFSLSLSRPEQKAVRDAPTIGSSLNPT